MSPAFPSRSMSGQQTWLSILRRLVSIYLPELQQKGLISIDHVFLDLPKGH
jgi:hypothetical protein